MATFTQAELDYLAAQPLMRFASASPKGRPDVATVVVDDLASVDPWSPRGIKVRGRATIEADSEGERFRITPQVIWSWGISREVGKDAS